MLALQKLKIVGTETDELYDIVIDDEGVIKDLDVHEKSNPLSGIDLSGCIAFSGLINAHDHLEFNLFPQLTTQFFNNYKEWTESVQGNHQETIAKITKVPYDLRCTWGAIKNLISGFTTVVHHGPSDAVLKEDIVHVHHTSHLHSLQFENFWRIKMITPSCNDVVAHLGEGVDKYATNEAKRLFSWNIWKKNIIAIHGIGITAALSTKLKGLVWCPDSNLKLYGQTANTGKLKDYVPILFGADSTLTSSWNIWEHLNIARSLNYLSDRELFDAITTMPKSIFQIDKDVLIKRGRTSDLVIAKPKNNADKWGQLYSTQPEDVMLIIRDGKIIHADRSINIVNLEKSCLHNTYWPININDRTKFVSFDILHYCSEISTYDVDINMPLTSSDQPVLSL